MYCCLVREPAGADASAPGTGPGGGPAAVALAALLDRVARTCSPRVMAASPSAVLFDASGLSRVLGPDETIAREVARLAADHGVPARVALSATMSAAWLLAHSRPGVTVVPRGQEAARLAGVPLGWLGTLAAFDRLGGAAASRRWEPEAYAERLATCARWGLRTMGDLAALPRQDLHARLGPLGVFLHRAVSGQDARMFVPAGEEPAFVDRLALEWPIHGLEPLAFVLARQCERLAAALERADRGAIRLRTTLDLSRRPGETGRRAVHERVLTLPAPLTDARVLRTLILLDLESHRPPAAVEAIAIECGVAPRGLLQGTLFTRPAPARDALTTLLARLGALMGETRVGSPRPLDTHDTRAAALDAFRLDAAAPAPAAGEGGPVLRRFRVPLAARVVDERGAPVRVQPAARGLAGGDVVHRAGPWRTSGSWWARDAAWDRDEWDVALATGDLYRLARDRHTRTWTIEGILD
jgi:protein ImuB